MFFEPIYIPWAVNTGTCIQQGDLFYPAGLHEEPVLATANTGGKNTPKNKQTNKQTKNQTTFVALI